MLFLSCSMWLVLGSTWLSPVTLRFLSGRSGSNELTEKRAGSGGCSAPGSGSPSAHQGRRYCLCSGPRASPATSAAVLQSPHCKEEKTEAQKTVSEKGSNSLRVTQLESGREQQAAAGMEQDWKQLILTQHPLSHAGHIALSSSSQCGSNTFALPCLPRLYALRGCTFHCP